MIRAFEHVTITTGASRMSPRAEVTDSAVEQVRAAMQGRDLADVGLDWKVLVIERQPEGVGYDLLDGTRPIMRCFLCVRPDGAASMWRAAASYAAIGDTKVRLVQPMAAPWLAAVLLPGALDSDPMRVMEQLPDLARIVAWALIEKGAL